MVDRSTREALVKLFQWTPKVIQEESENLEFPESAEEELEKQYFVTYFHLNFIPSPV